MLRPRFSIRKTRISEEEKTPQETDCVPDKIVYIEIDDEITAVFDRVKRVKGKNIALVIPKRAAVLQSVINLKILKKKLDEIGKEIIIATTDPFGLELAEKAGIQVTEKLFEKKPPAAENWPALLASKPLPKSERPMRLTGEKVSLSEIIRRGKIAPFSSLLNRLKERIKKRKKTTDQTKLVFIAPNKQALFTLILISILLLLAIAYIALPGATIYLTPKSTILDASFNVTFLDYEKNQDLIENPPGSAIIIGTYPVNPPLFTKKFTHPATGKLFQGKNATGTITVTNLSNSPWDLAARTRFQTDDGLVFRTPRPVRIPPAVGNMPGTLNIFVIADEFDANGQIIGERGNIPASKFFLPGLKNSENRKKLYGESKNPMAGGVTRLVKTVSKEDAEAAKQFAKKEILKEAAEDLKKYLEEQNLVKKTRLSLLTDRNAIKTTEPAVAAQENIIGKAVDQFEITATYSANGVAFDRQGLVDMLKSRLINRVDPDKKILRIEENDISYKFLDEDNNAGKIRLTATMRAIQGYELDPDKENGHRFVKKITDHILGMKVDDAIAYLQQQTEEIARVEITTWPVWAPTIPNIADNVKFVVKEENDLQ